jgi:hypothetical protein
MTRQLVSAFCLGLTLALACSPGPGSKPPRHNLSCPDGTTRPAMDCQTDLGLRERVIAANASLGQTGIGIGGKYEERAVGQVTDSTYHLALKLESACKEYNACVGTPESYSAQAQMIREQLGHHVSLVGGLEKGVSAQLGDEIWSNAVPELAAQRLAMDWRLEAVSNGQTIIHADGAPRRRGGKIRGGAPHDRRARLCALAVFERRGERAVPESRDAAAQPVAGRTRSRDPERWHLRARRRDR